MSRSADRKLGGHRLTQLRRGQAARRQHVDIDRISFIDAARWLAAAQADEPLPPLVVSRIVENLGCLYPSEIAWVQYILDWTIA